jgi:hypothetical protein
MDFNIVTLEIADLITHFDYYDTLVSDALSNNLGSADEQTKIRNKSKEHLTAFFADTDFYNEHKQLLSLSEMKGLIIAKLQGMKTTDIHDLVEKLEKDAKKIRKLYKSLTKK